MILKIDPALELTSQLLNHSYMLYLSSQSIWFNSLQQKLVYQMSKVSILSKFSFNSEVAPGNFVQILLRAWFMYVVCKITLRLLIYWYCYLVTF